MKWYLTTLKKYAIFNGRSRRTEYWMFVLLNTLIMLGLSFLIINEIIGLSLIYVFAALTVIPTVSVTVRRLHDTNRSAWWLLLPLIPILGELVFLVFMVLAAGTTLGLSGCGTSEEEQGVVVEKSQVEKGTTKMKGKGPGDKPEGL